MLSRFRLASKSVRTGWPSRVDHSGELIKTIAYMRKQKRSLRNDELERVNRLIGKREIIENCGEKELSLALNLVISPGNYREGTTMKSIQLLCEKLAGDSSLSLQGVNQVLGGFARLKTKKSETKIPIDFCEKIFNFFVSKYMNDSCPNRELVNIAWAANVLRLDDSRLLPVIEKRLPLLECQDIANVCAALMDQPTHPTWPALRQEILSRKRFSNKSVGLILCNLACAGINDRELILHLVSVIHRTEALTIENVAAIIWAVATCDFVDAKLLNKAAALLETHGDRITDPMDVRRISRGFQVGGQLKRIEKWIMQKAVNSDSSDDKVTDTLLIWELTTCGLVSSALELFRSRPIDYWTRQIKKEQIGASQLYHLYLGSLVDDACILTPNELEYLKSLRSSFAITTDDMLSSVLHRQASAAVKKLKYEHVSEYQEPVSGYVVDIYIPELNLGIEVQGPTHFVTDIETGASILREPDRFKERVLGKVAGMRIVHATPYNFGPKVKGRNEVLMRGLIKTATKKHS